MCSGDDPPGRGGRPRPLEAPGGPAEPPRGRAAVPDGAVTAVPGRGGPPRRERAGPLHVWQRLRPRVGAAEHERASASAERLLDGELLRVLPDLESFYVLLQEVLARSCELLGGHVLPPFDPAALSLRHRDVEIEQRGRPRAAQHPAEALGHEADQAIVPGDVVPPLLQVEAGTGPSHVARLDGQGDPAPRTRPLLVELP